MAQDNKKNYSNREVKSSAFTAFFSEPENAAALYYALEGEEVEPDEIDYTTLSDVLFLARKNDMAFLARKRVLVISEHQSTINENMPLRGAIYYGRTMEQLVKPKALYQRKQIRIPTPEFYVFYNGDKPFPPEKTLRISDSYLDKDKKGMLELEVKVININLPVQHSFLQDCRPMYEYSYFIDKIKSHISEGKTRDEAILNAMQECRDQGVLTAFIDKHGTEVLNMLFTQFNMEDALEVCGEEAFEDGLAMGRARDIVEILEEYGVVDEVLRERILAEQNEELLSQWFKRALRIKDVAEFREASHI